MKIIRRVMKVLIALLISAGLVFTVAYAVLLNLLTYEGTVVHVGENFAKVGEVVITVEENGNRENLYPLENAKILDSNGKKISAAEIKEGMRIKYTVCLLEARVSYGSAKKTYYKKIKVVDED